MKLALPASLRDQIAHEALAAYPSECCGLIEGVRHDDALQAVALHPARNLAVAADRFDLDPSDHLAAQKAARAHGRALIGCYHSHPGGRPEPSQADRSGAAGMDFLWLIAATDGARCRLKGFVYRESSFEDIVFSVGADLVTSSLNERS
jgi:proteasome lid subunit RPN8/RPN11